MNRATYMLDTNICSYIMRMRPTAVLERLEQAAARRHAIVVSAISYAEMRVGAADPRASPKVGAMVSAFVQRLDAILPWDRAAVDATVAVRTGLNARGTSISQNDCAIAGHAIAANCILVTHNTREFVRIQQLRLEDWAAG